VRSVSTKYFGRVDVINLDWDDPDSRVVFRYFGILDRSTYYLLDPDGGVIFRWVGPLSKAHIQDVVEKALEEHE
jgi:hypothetical protein